MLTVNHIITASVLVCMMAFSPMTISMFNDDAPRVATIADNHSDLNYFETGPEVSILASSAR